MTRPPRPDPIDGWHHVMSRGVNRSHVFTTEDDRLRFGRLLSEITRRHGIEVHAYCLMGTHFHLLLRCPQQGLSAAMHLLLSSFARSVNDRNSRVGHLFGDRFCSRLITDVRYLANVVRYIHRNPLDIADVSDLADYRWSSHRTYVKLRPRPSWLHLHPVLGWFDDPESFDRFVQGSPFPSSALVARPAELTATVDLLLSEQSNDLARHFPAQRRAALLTLLPNLDANTGALLIDQLSITSPGALRTAKSRARSLRNQEPLIDRITSQTEQLFAPAPIRPGTDAACA